MWPNCFEIMTSDAMQSNVSDIDSFYSVLKKWLKLTQKSDFLVLFQRFFVYDLLTSDELNPNLLPN